MYLDTDIILALIKPEDWLKAYVERGLEEINEEKVTSLITVIESELVLMREYSRELALSAFEEIKKKGIKLLPISVEVIEESTKLLKKYSKLNIFDSVHLANAMLRREEILSTDSLFDEIEGIKRVDPRTGHSLN